MIKIRSGVFETNSSSTHTCIIMAGNNYNKWKNGEVAYIRDNNIRELIEKYSKKEYIVDEDFVEVEAFKDIPAKVLFLEDSWRKDYYTELADKYTLYDLWNEYLKIPYDSFDCFDEREFGEGEEFPYKVDPEIRKVLNRLSGNEENYTNLYDWEETFKEGIGISSIDNIFNGNLERDISRETINGQEIVVICEYGYNG